MKIELEKDRKVYTITFDEYGVLDTVELDGKGLTRKNKVVKSILVHEDTIRSGLIPKGFNKVVKKEVVIMIKPQDATHQCLHTKLYYKEVKNVVYVYNIHGRWVESIGGSLNYLAHMKKIN